MRKFAAVFLPGTLAGCVPAMLQQPTVHEDDAVVPRMACTWLSAGDEPGFAFIGENDGAMGAVLVNVLKNGRPEVKQFKFYRASSRAERWLIVTDEGANGNKRRRLANRYRFESDHRFSINWRLSKRVRAPLRWANVGAG